MSRPRPDTDAVRDELRERDEEIAGAEPATSSPAADGAEPAVEHVEAEEEAREAASEEDPLEDLRRERDEYLELARRSQADFENYKKRVAKDVAAAGARARIGLIRELLPVVDNLERALASAGDGEHGSLVEGLELVLSELNGVLARAGIDVIEPAGEPFDPVVHEALATREQDGASAGVVLDVVEKGYRTGDLVIRPARVVVAA